MYVQFLNTNEEKMVVVVVQLHFKKKCLNAKSN